MVGIEWRYASPKEVIHELERIVQLQRESKYDYQTGLKDLDFDIDHEQLLALELTLPLRTVDQAEIALRNKGIQPITFIEQDNTKHQVIAFDSRPIGYSGFMDCVTHSLALTDHGLFEVGRYPAVNLSSRCHHWGWFLHRRLAAPEELASWQDSHVMTPEEIIDQVHKALTGS